MHFTGCAAAAATGPAIAAAAVSAAAAGSTGGLTGRTAVGATIGLVLKAFAREELLFAGAEYELIVAIYATEVFVCVQLLGVFPKRLIINEPARGHY